MEKKKKQKRLRLSEKEILFSSIFAETKMQKLKCQEEQEKNFSLNNLFGVGSSLLHKILKDFSRHENEFYNSFGDTSDMKIFKSLKLLFNFYLVISTESVPLFNLILLFHNSRSLLKHF